jgi:hypothetical protein
MSQGHLKIWTWCPRSTTWGYMVSMFDPLSVHVRPHMSLFDHLGVHVRPRRSCVRPPQWQCPLSMFDHSASGKLDLQSVSSWQCQWSLKSKIGKTGVFCQQHWRLIHSHAAGCCVAGDMSVGVLFDHFHQCPVRPLQWPMTMQEWHYLAVGATRPSIVSTPATPQLC